MTPAAAHAAGAADGEVGRLEQLQDNHAAEDIQPADHVHQALAIANMTQGKRWLKCGESKAWPLLISLWPHYNTHS